MRKKENTLSERSVKRYIIKVVRGGERKRKKGTENGIDVVWVSVFRTFHIANDWLCYIF